MRHEGRNHRWLARIKALEAALAKMNLSPELRNIDWAEALKFLRAHRTSLAHLQGSEGAPQIIATIDVLEARIQTIDPKTVDVRVVQEIIQDSLVMHIEALREVCRCAPIRDPPEGVRDTVPMPVPRS